MSASSKRENEEKPEGKIPAKKDDRITDKLLQEKKTIDLSKRPVILDQIRKEVISLEKRSLRNWDNKYDYLSGELFQKILEEEAVRAGFPADVFKRTKPKDPPANSSVPPSIPSGAFPKTSSSIVGWRSARKECNLEFTGPMYVSPRRTIEPTAEEGEFRVTRQRFILLG